MNTRIPTLLLGRTLQAASAIYTAASTDATDIMTALAPHEHDDGETDQSLTLAVPKNQQLAATAPATFVIPREEWDAGSVARFDQLAEKEALGVATPEDIEQLESLSALRRQEIPRTGEEVVREYEQGQLIRDLLISLTKYVEFAKQPAERPSKARSGTQTKTSGA